MNKPDLFNEDNSATYCPEDDKLRLYVGRVPRDEYEALRKEGWTSTPKQNCDFVAVWTPEREDTALSYAGIILDEDQGPEDRAADRAERFGGYRDKRLDEAVGHADRYDAGPSAHGYQSQARADRAAARHDRIADRSLNAWDKAEYWTQRTAGVISHALHNSSPGVRMGRIKTLEADLRKAEKNLSEWGAEFARWEEIAAMTDPAEKTAAALRHTGSTCGGSYDFRHPRPETCREYFKTNPSSLYSLLSCDVDPITGDEACRMFLARYKRPATLEEGTRYTRHLKLRLAYEAQMLEAQGGRAAHVEMEKGGTLGGKVIAKVNKSPKTQRVVSVAVIGPRVECWTYQATNEPGTPFALYTIETERLAPGAYQPPTDESRAGLAAFEKARKEAAAARKEKVPTVSLINPTEEDARRLQDLLNSREKVPSYVKDHVPSKILKMTQAQYSELSKGTYARATARELRAEAQWTDGGYRSDAVNARRGPVVCKVRFASGGEHCAPRVIVLTDKPGKPLPVSLWQPYDSPDTPEKLVPLAREIVAMVRSDWQAKHEPANKALRFRCEVAGITGSGTSSAIENFTEFGMKWAREHAPELFAATV